MSGPVSGPGSHRVVRRWRGAAGFGLVGVVAAGALLIAGSPVQAVLFLVLFGALAWAASPALFPRTVTAAEAQRLSAVDGRPVVYVRPGCQFCLNLRVRLGRSASRAHWVDIWRDPEGAAAVRTVTGGDETVPTVVARDETRVNPDPAWVRSRLA